MGLAGDYDDGLGTGVGDLDARALQFAAGYLLEGRLALGLSFAGVRALGAGGVDGFGRGGLRCLLGGVEPLPGIFGAGVHALRPVECGVGEKREGVEDNDVVRT